jgi:diguanylate cyclase (GGDEF)-like protein
MALPATGVIEAGNGVSDARSAEQAGIEAVQGALSGIRRHKPSAIFAFASAHYRLSELLAGMRSVAGEVPLLGATTAGEICDRSHRRSVAVLALASPYLAVRFALGTEVTKNWPNVIDQLTAASAVAEYFGQGSDPWQRLSREGKAAFGILFCPGNTRRHDARCYETLEAIKLRSLGRLPVLLGAAGDNWRMERNFVFCGRQAHADAALLAVFETKLRFGIGIANGFRATDATASVTAVDDHEVLMLDGVPAAPVFARLLRTSAAAMEGKHLTLATGHPFGTADPMGQFSINAPSYTTARGGIRFTQPLTPGTVLRLMEPDGNAMPRAGPDAVRKAMLRAGINDPAAVLVSYCALRPRLLGDAESDREVRGIAELANGAPVVGFHSFGEGGTGDDGVSRFSNAAVAALVLGHSFSPAAHAAHENEQLRQELSSHAELLERRVDERTIALRQRDAILSAIAYSSSELLVRSALEPTVTRVLARLGEAVNADAAWVSRVEIGRGGRRRAPLFSEWTAPGGAPPIGLAGDRKVDLYRWFSSDSAQDEPVCVSAAASSGMRRRILDHLGIKSCLLLPIWVAQERWGMVSLVHRRRPHAWSDLEKGALRMAAALLGNAIGRNAAEEKLAVLARTDPLTGLANRTTFKDRLDRAFADAQAGAPPFAVHYIDLDRFKSINDELGHAAGDTLLKVVATRLTANTREADLVARLGGDEFAVFQADADASVGRSLAERMQTALLAPLRIAGSTVSAGASIGTAYYSAGVSSPGELLAEADRALYRAKAERST